MARLAALCGLLAALVGCGGRSTSSLTDAPSEAAAACQGELTLKGDRVSVDRAPLRCEQGVVLQESGMGRLELAFGDGGKLRVNLPFVESGAYDAASCALVTAIHGNTVYALQGEPSPWVPRTSVKLELERSEDELVGRIESELCAVIGQRFEGDAIYNIYSCVTLSIPSLRARIEPEMARCGCTPTEGSCDTYACSEGVCALVQCPRGAPICQR